MRILIADDDAILRRVLEAALVKWGYDVVVTCDGTQAWQALQREDAPQLAILDWMMPGMDGIELCRKIREAPNLKPTYVIILTAKGSREDIVAGLEAGADDYITKSFDHEELRARVSVGARIARYETVLAEKNSALERYASQMEELAEERSKQLLHTERMATVGLLSAGIAHEINNPTASISGNAQIQAEFWEKLDATLLQHVSHGGQDSLQLEFILEEMPKTIQGIQNGVKRISRIVKGLRAFCRQEEGKRTVCNVNGCVEESLVLCHNALKHRVRVVKNLANPLPEIMANVQQIEQVLINLFVNAADAAEEQGQGMRTLIIQTQRLDDDVAVIVEDNGPGIPPDKLDDIWKPFFTTKTGDKGIGLGLSIARGIIESHSGQITAENRPNGGAKFTITLPALLQGDQQ